VERTGCGDAFGSGFTAALAYGHDVKEAMQRGNVNAAGVIQFIGAQEGLRKKKEVEETLAGHPDYQPSALTEVRSQ
jgi:sugar/nucleoside kinase (ribokinase family)